MGCGCNATAIDAIDHRPWDCRPCGPPATGTRPMRTIRARTSKYGLLLSCVKLAARPPDVHAAARSRPVGAGGGGRPRQRPFRAGREPAGGGAASRSPPPDGPDETGRTGAVPQGSRGRPGADRRRAGHRAEFRPGLASARRGLLVGGPQDRSGAGRTASRRHPATQPGIPPATRAVRGLDRPRRRDAGGTRAAAGRGTSRPGQSCRRRRHARGTGDRRGPFR